MKQCSQDIEQRDHRSQACLNVWFQAVKHPLEIANDRKQGERGLHFHPIVPRPLRTHFAVFWHAVLPAKSKVGQHDAASTELLDQRIERIVWDIHGIPVPIDHLPKAVEHPAELDANTPTPFVFGLFAKLLRTATFPNGKQQLDRVTVNDQEKARIGQEALVPVLMRDQQPLQTSAIRQTRKKVVIVALKPAIKGAEMASFQGEQQTDGDQLAGIQLGLAVLWYLFHVIIDKAKDLNDNVFGGHSDSSCARVFFCFSLGHDCCDHLNLLSFATSTTG